MFLLTAFALTWVLCDSDITRTIRNYLSRFSFFKTLLNCYFCSGFWCSLVAYPLYYSDYNPLTWFGFGLAGAAFSFICDIVLGFLTTVGSRAYLDSKSSENADNTEKIG